VDVALQAHGRAATAIVLYLSIVGLWGLLLGIRGLGPSPNLIGALVISEIASLAQGAVGVALMLGGRPATAIHVLYGLALAAALPLAATLVRGRPPRSVSFAFGFMCLFAAGLAIRGITTA